MARWCLRASLVVFACLAQRAATLATPLSAEQFSSQELGQRTVSRHDRSAAVVSGLGVVGVQVREEQSPVTGFEDRVVYGKLMVGVMNAPLFVRNAVVRSTVQSAIKTVAESSGSQVMSVTVLTNLTLPESIITAASIEFQAEFTNMNHRQTFISSVATDGAQRIVNAINVLVPAPYTNKIVLPTTPVGFLQDAVAAPQSPRRCYGDVSFNNVADPLSIARDPTWQEAVAVVIAETAWVSRLQVGLLMSVKPVKVLVLDFWLTSANCQDAVARVERAGSSLMNKANSTKDLWDRMSVASQDIYVYGRLAFEVKPGQSATVADNTAVKTAVDNALREVATNPGPQESNLSLKIASGTLVPMGADMVRVRFMLIFRLKRDQEVFAWIAAMDGGEELGKTMSARVSQTAYAGTWQLPAQQLKQAVNPKLGNVLTNGWFLAMRPFDIVSEPNYREAVAMTAAQLASVPLTQVGVLVGSTMIGVRSYYWVVSANQTFRQVATAKVEAISNWEFVRRTLVQLNALRVLPPVAGVGESVLVSIMLQVGDPQKFATDPSAREPLRTAISTAAGVPVAQVQIFSIDTGFWPYFTKGAKLEFSVAFGTLQKRQAFAASMATDGSEKLASSISNAVPMPHKGTVKLPAFPPTQALGTVSSLSQQYGTFYVSVFYPQSFTEDRTVRGPLAKIIAGLAGMSRPQVGLMLSVQSGTVVRVDFWIVSSNAAVRQAAVQRVNAGWNNSALDTLMSEWHTYISPLFTACGGTVACCPTPNSLYKC